MLTYNIQDKIQLVSMILRCVLIRHSYVFSSQTQNWINIGSINITLIGCSPKLIVICLVIKLKYSCSVILVT